MTAVHRPWQSVGEAGCDECGEGIRTTDEQTLDEWRAAVRDFMAAHPDGEPAGPGQALERAPELPNPLTGELVPLGDVPAVCGAIVMLDERIDLLLAAKRAFAEACVDESKRIGKKTLRPAGYEVKVGADTELEWDATVLLEQLPKAGLPEERLAELVTTTVEYKVNGSVAREVAGASDAYAAIIESAKGRRPKRVSVSVKPTGGGA